MVRTNLSIDKSVFEEFAAEADRRKMTLFAFANESLSAITKISQEGGNPEEFYKIWRVLTILREVDVITLPSDFVEEFIERLYKADPVETKTRFRDLGTSIVGLLKIAAEDIEDLTPLAKDFGFFIPIKHFDLTSTKDGRIRSGRRRRGKGDSDDRMLLRVSEVNPRRVRVLGDEGGASPWDH